MTIPADQRSQVPDVVRDMQNALSHLRCYRVCEQHVGDHAFYQQMKDAASAKIQAGIDWLITAPELQVAKNAELQSRIDEIQKTLGKDLEKAKAAANRATDQLSEVKEQRDTYKARAETLEKLSRDLQLANLSRPDVAEMVQLIVMLMSGLKYVGYVEDKHDVNRQLVCGMRLLCQGLLRELGAEVDVSISDDNVLQILTKYYASIPQRDVDALRGWAHFHTALPVA